MLGSSVAKRDDGPTVLSLFQGEESPRRQVLASLPPERLMGLAKQGLGLEIAIVADRLVLSSVAMAAH